MTVVSWQRGSGKESEENVSGGLEESPELRLTPPPPM